MEYIKISISDSVALLTLNKSATNPICNDLVCEFKDKLSHLESNPAVNSVVITSNNEKIFSFGFDLPKLLSSGASEFSTFFINFNELCLQMYAYSKPLLAAVTGYAMAGGCIIALCCDYRILSDKKCSMGLQEVKLGITVPRVATIILEHLVGQRYAEEAVLTGELYEPGELLKRGWVDELCDPNNLLKAAIEKAQSLSLNRNPAYQYMKSYFRNKVIGQIREEYDSANDFFFQLWHSKGAQKLLHEAAKKF